jgi:hypothetical protein
MRYAVFAALWIAEAAVLRSNPKFMHMPQDHRLRVMGVAAIVTAAVIAFVTRKRKPARTNSNADGSRQYTNGGR